MTFQSVNRVSTLALLAAMAGTGPIWADVTPEEVWQNWQDSSAAMGQTMLAASAARNGDALVVTGITIASAAEGVTVEGSIETLTLTDQGDGTVLATMSPEFPMKMRLPAIEPGKPDAEMTLLFTQEGLTMLASGTADAISYDISAPSMAMKLDSIAGTDSQAANFTLDATFSDLAGSYATAKTDAGMTATSDLTLSGLAMAMVGGAPANGSEMRMTAAMEGITSKSEGSLLAMMAGGMTAPDMLAKVNSTSEMTSQSTQFDVEIVDETGPTTVKGTMGPGSFNAAIAGGVIEYAGTQTQLAMNVTSPNIPLPDLSVTMAGTEFGLTMPIAPTDAAVPFAFKTSLQDLALSEQLWAMFDPSAQLPRDPINFVIDADGMAKANAMPADAATTPFMPAELETLNLKQVRLSLAGATLAGAGTSTFEVVEGGLPNPNAKLDFTLTGANGLMDKLVAAGLLTPEMLTMPRMMLAMVARPSADGADSYESAIEIKDKAIFANGQKLHQME